MNGVSSWLLSIAGVIILSVLAEFILPEGQINKYTKVIFSFVILLVIILPLPQVFGKDFDLSKFFYQSESSLQTEYLEQFNLDKLNALSEDLSTKIEDLGLKKVKVAINANIFDKTLKIYGIYVDLRDLEYTENFGSKDISKAKYKIRELIDSFSDFQDVEVKFDE
ncbi:MAG: stage III sporulation protein AF [Candidatus Caccovivens sp.]